MHKRLFGFLASIARHRGGCGGATTSSPAAVGGARAPRAASSSRPSRPRERGRSRRGADPQGRPRQRAPDPRPQQGAGLGLDRVLPRLQPRPARTSTRTSRSSRRSPSRCPSLGRRQDHDLPPARRKVQQRRPDRRRRLRLQLEAPGRPAHRGAVLRYVMAEVVGAARPARAWPARIPLRPTPISTQLLAKLGVSAPDDKTFVGQPDHPGDLLPDVADPVDHGSDPGEVDQRARTATEAGELRQLRPVHARQLGPQQPDHPQAEPELVRRRKPTLTEIHMSR